MAQIHFYVPSDLESILKRRAAQRGVSLSRFIADLVRREVDTGWPDGYLDQVIGSWQGEPLERPEQGSFEARESL